MLLSLCCTALSAGAPGPGGKWKPYQSYQFSYSISIDGFYRLEAPERRDRWKFHESYQDMVMAVDEARKPTRVERSYFFFKRHKPGEKPVSLSPDSTKRRAFGLKKGRTGWVLKESGSELTKTVLGVSGAVARWVHLADPDVAGKVVLGNKRSFTFPKAAAAALFPPEIFGDVSATLSCSNVKRSTKGGVRVWTGDVTVKAKFRPKPGAEVAIEGTGTMIVDRAEQRSMSLEIEFRPTYTVGEKKTVGIGKISMTLKALNFFK